MMIFRVVSGGVLIWTVIVGGLSGAVHSLDAAEVANEPDIAGSVAEDRLGSQRDCQPTVGATDTSTDVYWGEIWLTDDGEPLIMYSWEYRSYPSLLSPSKLDENSPVLTIDLLNSAGEITGNYWGSTIEQFKFQPSRYPGEDMLKLHRYAQFRVEIPDPPEYSSVVMRYDDRIIGNIARSVSSPVVEIIKPECGNHFAVGQDIRLTWAGYDLDGYELSYEVWYSIDSGTTYKLTELRNDKTFYPSEFKRPGQVDIKVFANNGTRIAYDWTYINIINNNDFDDDLLTSLDKEYSACGEIEQPTVQSERSRLYSSRKTTDIIYGTILVTEGGIPLRLESLNIESIPVWEIEHRANKYRVNLLIELHDISGNLVYATQFATQYIIKDYRGMPKRDRRGNRIVDFHVYVPNPPQYESVTVSYNSREVGKVWFSKSDPVVQILSPKPGTIFCHTDLVQSNGRIDFTWVDYDKDGDDIEHNVWISVDGGQNFKLVRSLNAILITDIYKAGIVFVRIYVTDGRRTAYDETYFRLQEAEETDKILSLPIDSPTSLFRSTDITFRQDECRLLDHDLHLNETSEDITHYVYGDVIIPPDGREPIYATDIMIEQQPHFVSPEKLNDDRPTAYIELRDTNGETIYSLPFSLSWPHVDYFSDRPDGRVAYYPNWATIRVPIPNPPQYDSIAILFEERELAVRHKSQSAPYIEILEPFCGKTFAYNDEVRIIFKNYDLDGDRLHHWNHKVWYSIDGGKTYDYTFLQKDNTFRPGIFDGASRVYIRLYATDGLHTSVDETYIEFEDSGIDKEVSQLPEEVKKQDKCTLDESTVSSETQIMTVPSTDIIKGVMHVSEKGNPLRLESLELESVPGLRTNPKLNENDTELELVLLNELDFVVHRSDFSVKPGNASEFFANIPAPPEYDTIEIYHSGKIFETIPKSYELPRTDTFTETSEISIIKIRQPEYGRVYCYSNVHQLENLIDLSWDANFRFISGSNSDLKYNIWISIDNGKTYAKTDLLNGSFYPSDLYGNEKILVRVYGTDGRYTAFDETFFELRHVK